MLSPITIPSSVTESKIDPDLRERINQAYQRIETFQDRWDRPQIEQFVAADYEHVYQSLRWTLQSQLMIGRRFLEWGCGFAIVSALASLLELDVIGIESEQELLLEGRKTIENWNAQLELVHGNFLPRGSETLADDPTLPSLGHEIPSAYDAIGLDLDDFAIVYAYPWPGEEDFHEHVFDRHAAQGSLLLLFCGPNDIRLWRKH